MNHFTFCVNKRCLFRMVQLIACWQIAYLTTTNKYLTQFTFRKKKKNAKQTNRIDPKSSTNNKQNPDET